MLYAWVDEKGALCVTYDLAYVPKGVKYVEFPDLDILDADKLKIENGRIVKKTDEEILNELKQRLLSQLISATTSYIEKYYPEVKQRSDISDKEYWGSWLLARNPNYTTDKIYASVFQSVARIMSGQTTLDQELQNYPETERIAWEQLIKVGLRVAFVQAVKQEHHQLAQAIQNAQTKEELESIQIQFKTRFPL